MKIPQHVAIIMDGNGRWAKKQGKPRSYGHTVGAKNLETVCEAAEEFGIKYLTVYAFSTENWNRPKMEVNALMKLMESYLEKYVKTANERNLRVCFVGDRTGFTAKMQEKIENCQNRTAANTGITLTIALNYGSRDEIMRAVRRMVEDKEAGMIRTEDIDEELMSSYLDTRGFPDPDLLIRTGGEQRLSNFLLWQLAYSEFYFTDVLWPDFGREHLLAAIEAYNKRDRRFGAIEEEQEDE